MIELQGRYFDGKSSASVDARLVADNSGCTLHLDNADAITLDPAVIVVTDRVGNTPRRIAWGGVESFVTQDNDGADELQELSNPNFSSAAHWLESNLTIAIGAVITIALLYGAALWWGIPWAAREVAHQIPDSVSRQVASQTMETLDRIAFEPSQLDASRQNQLRGYLQSYDSFVGRIDFRAAPDIGANAFALPGGHIVITDELVCLAERDEEILGVYLHEVGHARGRHGEAMALQNSAWLVVLTLITGDISGVSDAIFTLPVIFGQSAFSRELETEADDYAIEALHRNQVSPAHLADALERMSDPAAQTYNPCTQADELAEAISGREPIDDPGADAEKSRAASWLNYLSTHPDTDERIKRMRASDNG